MSLGVYVIKPLIAGPLIAGIAQQTSGEGDALVDNLLKQLQTQGWHIRGLATEQGKDVQANKAMSVRDLYTGDIYVISSPLGPESRGCQLNIEALQQTAQVLQTAIQAKPDLIFINRFGTAESKGNGLYHEFVAIAEAGIPLLTLVSEKYLSAWQAFTQDLGVVLPLNEKAILDWVQQIPKNSDPQYR